MNSNNFEGWVQVSPTRWVRDTGFSTTTVEFVDGEVEVQFDSAFGGSDSGSVDIGTSIPAEILRSFFAT